MLRAEGVLLWIVLAAYIVSMALYFIFISLKKEKAARAALIVQSAGVLIHTALLVLRGIALKRLPLTGGYEFACSFAWGLSLVSLIFVLRFRFPVLGAFASPVTLLILGYAMLQNREAGDLMPSLRSAWLGAHVSTAVISYAAFGVSFVLSLIFLARDRMQQGGFLDKHIPKKELLDQISYRAVALGFLFLSFTIISGAIWAERSWGSYWSWDPKETWSLVTWIVYAVYLHLRLRRGWQGKAAAIFAVIGFVSVMFTYVGVNTLLPGLHSYA